MRRVKGRDTQPELALRRALWRLGVRGWRCSRTNLPGKPDLSFGVAKLAVFVDGAFWHGHPSKYTPGQSGAFWDAKIGRNQQRDTEVNEALADCGWTVLRFWDFEIAEDAEACAKAVVAKLAELR